MRHLSSVTTSEKILLEATDFPEHSDHTVQVRARGYSGDIVVRRA